MGRHSEDWLAIYIYYQLVKLALASCLENRSLKLAFYIELRVMPLSISFATGCSVNGVKI